MRLTGKKSEKCHFLRTTLLEKDECDAVFDAVKIKILSVSKKRKKLKYAGRSVVIAGLETGFFNTGLTCRFFKNIGVFKKLSNFQNCPSYKNLDLPNY
jgi:hypothetical protein